MFWRKITGAIAAAVLMCSCAAALAAPISGLRTSISPARVRLVLDSSAPVAYKESKDGLILTVSLPESSVKRSAPAIRDSFVKSAVLAPDGKDAGRLTVKLARDCQYKIYRLENPDRLVIDIFRISIIHNSRKLADGVTYIYVQDEINGRQIQAHMVEIAKDASYELRPFSAAGRYNGRGYVSAEAARQKLLAAVNASYFDSDGWVIGCTKDKQHIFSMDTNNRSAYAEKDGKGMIIQDVAYTGTLKLPYGKTLRVKGMNRVRIADDLVIYNEYYAPTTKTNSFGREVKVKDGRVISISTAGNMPIERGTYVISGHGVNAAALAVLRKGDKVVLEETLGSPAADAAEIVISGGPLLLEDGRANIRSRQENIAADIAKGRAPRTAVGLKKDGTVVMAVVDGRSGQSSGLTLNELAVFLLRQKVTDAVNFDGGGSSVMAVNGRVVNNPSDGRERKVSIGLGVFPR